MRPEPRMSPSRRRGRHAWYRGRNIVEAVGWLSQECPNRNFVAPRGQEVKERVIAKIPISRPIEARCDLRLPEAALTFRRQSAPVLTSPQYLGAINITAWLYRDKRGVEGIQVNPNTTISELIRQFGPAQTPDAEVGLHSEMKAAECGFSRSFTQGFHNHSPTPGVAF